MLSWEVVSTTIINPDDEHPTVNAVVAVKDADGYVITTKDFQYALGFDEVLQESADQFVAKLSEKADKLVAIPKPSKQEDRVREVVDTKLSEFHTEVAEKLAAMEERLSALVMPPADDPDEKRLLREAVSEIRGQLNALAADRDLLRTRLQAVEEALAMPNADLVERIQRIEDGVSKTDELNSRVVAVEAALVQARDSVNSLANLIAPIKDEVQSLKEALTAMHARVTEFVDVRSDDTQGIAAALTSIHDAVNAVQASVSTFDQRLDTLEVSVAGAKDDVATVAGSLEEYKKSTSARLNAIDAKVSDVAAKTNQLSVKHDQTRSDLGSLITKVEQLPSVVSITVSDNQPQTQ